MRDGVEGMRLDAGRYGSSQSHESLSWGSGNGVGMGSDAGRFSGTWRLDGGEGRKRDSAMWGDGTLYYLGNTGREEVWLGRGEEGSTSLTEC